MIRTIVGFHQDDAGDWVAHLSCLHRQHVRHRPPFFDRPWATTEEGRAGRIGTGLDCPLCDRAELPDGLDVVRTAGPFDEGSTPPALRSEHRVAAGAWGLLRVRAGEVRFRMATEPPVDRTIAAGGSQPIPPEVDHSVEPRAGATFEVDFLRSVQGP